MNEKAHVAPYGYEESSSFFSERMDVDNCSGIHPVYKNDWLAVLPEVALNSGAGGRRGALPAATN